MPWYDLLDSEIIYVPQLCLIGLLAILTLFFVTKNRMQLWPYLVIAAVGTGGIMIKSLSYADEVLVGCIVISFGFRYLMGKERINGILHFTSKVDAWHFIFFNILMFYLAIESVRGYLVLDSSRKLLWVIFYVMLGLLSVILTQHRNAEIPVRKLSFVVGWTALVYFSGLVGYGLYTETFRGFSRWYLQKVELMSSAQFMFPAAITAPSMIVLLSDKKASARWLGLGVLLALTSAALYYDSRVAILTLAFSLLVSWKIAGVGRTLLIILVFVISMGTLIRFSDVYKGDWEHFEYNMLGVSNALFTSEEKQNTMDLDRLIYMKVALPAITDSPIHLLFGHGMRTHSTVIVPYVRDLFSIYLPHRATDIHDRIGTEGFTATVVDTGLVGLFLLLANFFFVAWKIITGNSGSYKVIMLLILAAFFGWLFVINLSDFVLFYLGIMPAGIIEQQARSEKKLAKRQAIIEG
jgi:hypothetical protein